MTAPLRPIRVLIADDEPLARKRLLMLLADEDRIEVVAECADGASAIGAIQKLRPDLVFLDIEMPGASGFDLIDAIGAERMPAVIFVTAFDTHALRAFEVRALDYLLKPFDRDRFHAAVTRAREHIDGHADGELERRLLDLVHGLKPAIPPLERFVVKTSGRVFFVRASDIEWIEAAGNYVKLHVGAESHLFRETMNAVEGKLDADIFYRIHRSHIVNIERVRELQPSFNGEYVVCLKSGARLTLSRGYREKLQERIGRTL
jgi:two-component system LytT family response regulator